MMGANECKQVIVVRMDLKMGKGKIAAQVAHASLHAADETKRKLSTWYDAWKRGGEAKVVLKVGSLNELLEVESHARMLGLPVSLVEDRGLTQLPKGTVTCVGIGPGPSSLVDEVTGRLKLL